MLDPRTRGQDLRAQASVTLMAVPLTMAIGVASGVPPEVALVAAGVAAPVAALCGGTTLGVTGPAAAVTVLVSQAVGQHGLLALPLVTLGVGVLQLLSGLLNAGWLAKVIPAPVAAGFTSAVGVMICIGQLPRLMALAPARPEEGVLAILAHVWAQASEASTAAMAVGACSFGLITFLPRLHWQAGRLSIPVAVAAGAALAAGLEASGLGSVATVASLSEPLDWTLFARVPAASELGDLAPTILLLYVITSVESLLTSAAVTRTGRGAARAAHEHDPSQELVGQGLANVASGLALGMPVTCVIARSHLNVQSGARTRLSALLQGFLILGSFLLLWPWLAAAPIPALAAVSLFGGTRMLAPPEINHAVRVQRTDFVPFAATVLGMLAVGWVEGLAAGFTCSLALCGAGWNHPETARLDFGPAQSVRVALELISAERLQEMDKNQLIRLILGNYEKEMRHVWGSMVTAEDIEECWECGGEGAVLRVWTPSEASLSPEVEQSREICASCDGTGFAVSTQVAPGIWWLNGPLNFLSVLRIQALAEEVRRSRPPHGRAIFDLHGCNNVDLTGAEALVDGLHALRKEGIRVTLMNTPPELQRSLTTFAKLADFGVHRHCAPGVRPGRKSSLQEAELPFPE